MFKALRERLAGWRQRAAAEVKAENPTAVIGDTARKLKEDKLEEILYALEMALLESDVAFPVAKEIVDDLAEDLRGKRVSREVTLEQGVETALRDAITKAMTVPTIDLFEIIKGHPKPVVIMFVGVNGTGKTTTIAKMAQHFRARRGMERILLVAGDTFRAAAIDQLKIWGQRVGADVVAHQPGADPGAVAFDAWQAAHARHADYLIVDTAGRLQTKFNLMKELEKIARVLQKNDATAPHETFLVLDAVTGQNGLQQAREFKKSTPLTGLILTKLDGTAKGGIVVAIARELGLPIRFVGTGEQINDLVPFDAEAYANSLFD